MKSKLLFTAICLTFFHMNIHAQQQDKDQQIKDIELTIKTLFDGMRQGDSAKVAAVFDKNVSMYTSFTNEKGEKVLKSDALAPFLKAVGTPHDQIWDERLYNTKISTDGRIAQVWTEYSFYRGTDFSHCGVDAFHLVKENNGTWKIVHLMDTRRKTDCQDTP